MNTIRALTTSPFPANLPAQGSAPPETLSSSLRFLGSPVLWQDSGVDVVEIWRYPVKSMQGERLDFATGGDAGIVGDRSHALRDPATGVVLTARRDPNLLFGRGVLVDGVGQVDVPGHGLTTDDEAISTWIGRQVELIGATGRSSTYENQADPEDDASEAIPWEGPDWSFHDSRRTQVSLVATGDIGEWDVRRFRPNLVVDAPTADVLVGHRLRVGSLELDVVKQIDRCVMTTRPQPGGIERDLDVFRRIRDERNLFLAVGSMVHRPGEVRAGDPVEVIGSADPSL